MSDSEDLRNRAISSLRAKTAFWSILVTWLILSALFIIVWLFNGGVETSFSPVWPIAGIGVGVAFSAYNAFGPGRGGPTEDQIRNEMNRLS